MIQSTFSCAEKIHGRCEFASKCTGRAQVHYCDVDFDPNPAYCPNVGLIKLELVKKENIADEAPKVVRLYSRSAAVLELNKKLKLSSKKLMLLDKFVEAMVEEEHKRGRAVGISAKKFSIITWLLNSDLDVGDQMADCLLYDADGVKC